MIRKWSYLNLDYVNLNNESISFCTLKYNFKVFRVTTKFRKYNLGFTVMTRKKYARRKHRTNWITLSYILKYWVFFYLKSKQFSRFYQTLGLFNVQTYSANLFYFQKRLIDVNNYNGINSYSVPKIILSKFSSISEKSNFYKTPLLNNNSSGVLVRNLNAVILSESIAPGLVHYDNQFYAYNYNLNNNIIFQLNNGINDVILYKTLKFNIIFYQVLIYLTLLNIK